MCMRHTGWLVGLYKFSSNQEELRRLSTDKTGEDQVDVHTETWETSFYSVNVVLRIYINYVD